MSQHSVEQGVEPAILALRRRLLSTRTVSFSSQPGPQSLSGWAGHGNGAVVVAEHADGSVTFTETGHFRLATGGRRPSGAPVAFRNVFRWTPYPGRIALSHERRGSEAAVWLFDLVAGETPDTLVSAEAHQCGEDRYQARLILDEDGFALSWTIDGPRKQERLFYRYR